MDYMNFKNIITVISHGVGISENEAVKDALISAIKQVSGVFVFNETIINKRSIII